MPIYEYQCAGCNHHFDVIQKINDDPVKTCPKCTEDKVIRLVSAAGFQLKGTGWYATDFKTKDKKTTVSETPSTDGSSSTESSKKETSAVTTTNRSDT